MRTGVLIVGAGPTGLMLANQLARHGVNPMIIDRHAGPAEQTRAMAVHARTLEIYAKMGIAAEAIAKGAIGHGANMWVSGRWAARIPIGDIGQGLSAFPFVLMLGQDENERILGKALREHDVAVQWRTELVSLEQWAEHVVAVVRQPDGSQRTVEAAWVAGCDGSRSVVRELNGIGFPGAPYEHTFFVADTEATGSMKPSELNVYLGRDGFHLFFPMHGVDRWRVIGILPKPLRARCDVTFGAVIPAIQQETGAELEFRACDWFSTYRIHHRVAERFRDRRCILLGDAAHIHSPMGGQGMNTGLQDAYNLAWKLALVVNGEADLKLLDTYAQERVPVAQRLLATTDLAFRLVVSDSWIAGVLRTRVIAKVAARAMTFERVRRFAFMTLSQIGIGYSDSSVSEALGALSKGAPMPGDRFPWLRLKLRPDGPVEDLFNKLDDLRGQLGVIVVPQGLENDAELARRLVPRPSFYLLRPDGHVAYSGAHPDADAIRRYFTERVRLSAASRAGPAEPRFVTDLLAPSHSQRALNRPGEETSR